MLAFLKKYHIWIILALLALIAVLLNQAWLFAGSAGAGLIYRLLKKQRRIDMEAREKIRDLEERVRRNRQRIVALRRVRADAIAKNEIKQAEAWGRDIDALIAETNKLVEEIRKAKGKPPVPLMVLLYLYIALSPASLLAQETVVWKPEQGCPQGFQCLLIEQKALADMVAHIHALEEHLENLQKLKEEEIALVRKQEQEECEIRMNAIELKCEETLKLLSQQERGLWWKIAISVIVSGIGGGLVGYYLF